MNRLISRILAKAGPYSPSKDGAKVETYEKRAQKSLTKVWSRKTSLSPWGNFQNSKNAVCERANS